MSYEFKPGDLVRLKSGGPVMVVESNCGERVGVVWAREAGSEYFDAPPECFIPADAPTQNTPEAGGADKWRHDEPPGELFSAIELKDGRLSIRCDGSEYPWVIASESANAVWEDAGRIAGIGWRPYKANR